MIVNLQSAQIVQTDAFRREIREFPPNTVEEIFSLVDRFFRGERLDQRHFKIFKIARGVKIIEFKVKDFRGNWRAISVMRQTGILVFVYAFHKKSKELLQKDKELILDRVRRLSE